MKHYAFFDWIKNYKRSYLAGDFIAGLTVGVMLIPQGMAYSMLAGLPPIYGLYAATIPLIIYAVLGSSRQLAVGPVAMISLLIASGVGSLTEVGSETYIEYAIVLSLLVGLIKLTMGIFRLGFIVNFLSHPVIAGFTSAAAIIIGTSQLKHLLGISVSRGNFINTIQQIIAQFSNIHNTTFFIGVAAIGLLIAGKKISPKLPSALLVVVLSILLVRFVGLEDQGLAVIGNIPNGFPSFSLPSVEWSIWKALFPIALTITFVGFMESIAVAKAIQSKHKDHQIIPNQELIALGMTNAIGSLFQSFPVTGGFSRTAVNDQAGAKTGLASIFSAFIIGLTLLFFTTYFRQLPLAVLAAIIIVAVYKLVDIAEAKHLWKTDRQDFWLFFTTAFATLFLGIEAGIIIGVMLSLGLLIYKVSYPHMAILGKVPDSTEYRNIERFDNLEIPDEILVIRPDGRLYFANVESFRSFVMEHFKGMPQYKFVLIDAGSIDGVDSSAIHMLHDLNQELKDEGKLLCFANVKGPVRDVLSRNEVLTDNNAWRYFLSVHDGVSNLGEGSYHAHTSYVTQNQSKGR